MRVSLQKIPSGPRIGKAILLVLVLLLAGPAGLSLAQAPAEAQEGVPILVGASLSLTGSYAEPARKMHGAYRLWEQRINEKGGLLGRRVRLIIEDDYSSPQRAAAVYAKFIEERQVDLLLSPYGTPITLAVSEVTEAHGYVLMAAASAGEEVWKRGYSHVFGMYAQADRFFIGFIDICARNGIDSVSILYEKNPFNMDAANGAHRWAGRMGLSTIRLFGTETHEEAVRQEWERVEEAKNEALIVCSYPPVGHMIMDLLTHSSYAPKATAMTITPIAPGFYEREGEAAEGIFAPSLWEPNERIPFPGTGEFIKGFEEFTGKEATYHAASAYASCNILAEAVRTTGSIDHEKLRSYIAGLDTVTIIGRFKVDYTGKQVGQNPMLIQWQGGKKEIVRPRSVRTAEPVIGSTGGGP